MAMEERIHCPRCGSSNVLTQRRNTAPVREISPISALSPVGRARQVCGMYRFYNVCRNCGNRWITSALSRW